MFKTALILTAVGSLNWGLVALFDFNLVTAIFGAGTFFTNAVYVVVAAAAVVALGMGLTSNESSSRSTTTDREPAYGNQ